MTSRETGQLIAKHSALLWAGALLGIVAARSVTLLELDFSGELESARALGITSISLLRGHAESRDLVTYAAVLGLPVLCALAVWWPWARRHREALGEQIAPLPALPDRSRGWIACGLGALAFAVICSFNVNAFFVPGYNETVGGWIFIGEEGENLAWVQSLWNDGVYGRDFFCLYGPMLIYPLAWVMELLGESVPVARAYKYALDVVAYAIVIAVLFSSLRHKSVFSVVCLVYVLLFPTRAMVGVNGSFLRVALGLLPLLLVYLAARSDAADPRRRALSGAAGIVAGQSLLFSQEAGLCSVLAAAVMLAADAATRRNVRALAADAGWLAAGLAISLAPMLSYLYTQQALPAFLDSLYGYPRLVTLGYAGLPFPSFAGFLAAPIESGALLQYATIGIYAFTAIQLASTLAIRRGLDRRDALVLGLLVFGALLFRAALGRSDLTNAFKVWPPALLLWAIHVDDAVARLRRRGGAQPRGSRLRARRTGSAVRLAALVSWLALSVLATPYVWVRGVMSLEELRYFSSKWSVGQSGYALPRLERGGVYYDQKTAEALRELGFFLKQYTKPDEYVYFFPNEAAYYYLFDRKNPTRYAIAYFAATRDQRLELIEDLERKRPRFVVYSTDTWRVDGIDERVQVPEVVAYLAEHYRTIARLPGIEIQQRLAD